MNLFKGIPIFFISGFPFLSSGDTGDPFLGVLGQDRPGDVHLVPGESLVAASFFPVVGLEGSDHRLNLGPMRRKLPKPGDVFQRSPGDLPILGYGTGQEGIFRLGLRIPGLPSTSSEAPRSPFSIHREPS